MNRIKKALEKCRTYVAVQKFGCGINCIGHGVEDSLLQFLDEAFEELAWLEKREPTLMSDCISAGLPLDVALKYDVQLFRLTNYVRDKTLADCVKQEPIDESWCIEPKPVNGLLVSEHMEQEPVGVISESAIGLVKLHANGVSLPFGTQLYAAPVSAEAIRAEALEEAAKVCEQGTGDAVQTDVLKALWKERERIAEVIRGLK